MPGLAAADTKRLATRIWKILRDEGGFHSTGKVVGIAATHGLLDSVEQPRVAVEAALELLHAHDHVARVRGGKWAVTTPCRPVIITPLHTDVEPLHAQPHCSA